MHHTVVAALPSFAVIRSAGNEGRRKTKAKPQQNDVLRQKAANSGSSSSSSNNRMMNPGFGSSKKKEPVWQCIQNCGACCKLDKGPTFPSPEEIFDGPADIEKYTSMIGPDGWCLHFDKFTRRCTIYADRPYFCRVEPDIFQTLYGIDKKKFNEEACSCCIDTIIAVCGSKSEELNRFNHAIWNTAPSQTN